MIKQKQWNQGNKHRLEYACMEGGIFIYIQLCHRQHTCMRAICLLSRYLLSTYCVPHLGWTKVTESCALARTCFLWQSKNLNLRQVIYEKLEHALRCCFHWACSRSKLSYVITVSFYFSKWTQIYCLLWKKPHFS